MIDIVKLRAESAEQGRQDRRKEIHLLVTAAVASAIGTLILVAFTTFIMGWVLGKG